MNTKLLELSRMIDHSLLHPALTDRELSEGCELAAGYNTASVCIKPYAVSMAASLLEGTGVKVCSVAGFPHGNSTIHIKNEETLLACSEGATEVDMVINIGKALGGDWDYIEEEIGRLNGTCTASGADMKVIFENDYLSDSQIIRLCEICSRVNVAYIKTSTGYGFVKQGNGMYAYKGATPDDLRIMRANASPGIRIKAAGGIRTLDDLLFVKSIGVSRIGATATAAILDEAKRRIEEGLL